MTLRTRWLGRLPYTEAWDLQRAIHEGKVVGRTRDDYLLLLEHPPVFTIGRNGDGSNLLVDRVGLGVEVHHVDRGGDITFHGPGQLVGYPDPESRRSQADRSLRPSARADIDRDLVGLRGRGVGRARLHRGVDGEGQDRSHRRQGCPPGDDARIRPEPPSGSRLFRDDESLRDRRPAGDDSFRAGGERRSPSRRQPRRSSRTSSACSSIGSRRLNSAHSLGARARAPNSRWIGWWRQAPSARRSGPPSRS